MKITLVGFLLVASAVADQCGSHEYNPETHVCNDNQYVCPILSGEALASCGESCYSYFEYSCDNGKDLVPLPAVDKPFELVTYNLYAPDVHDFPVYACGHRLYFGNGSATCTYCPNMPQLHGLCNDPGLITNRTILLGGSGGYGLATQVPGGQRGFIGPEGGLNYTQAHSASVPNGSQYDGILAYQQGAFIDTKSEFGWAACGQFNADDEVPVWDILAFRKAVVLWDYYDVCAEVKLLVVEADLENGTYVPWQYE
ncbi:hypothetical protein BDV96DRAFT_637622 [Lophiotrema nucula]|uniref:Endo-1,3(4)-beta-glucanase 1 carbohydrate binding domain-containing protein n=1 Tax=Lophiotrema nucula TaxID=690887 RepID=A0A6A5YJJ0_9PLEO|nr:hypothetical protein BDV96DRAFT_637622 [Lophiotrema nucula]